MRKNTRYCGQSVTDADTYKAICEVVDRVWKGLTDNMKRKTLRKNQIPDWVEILHFQTPELLDNPQSRRYLLGIECGKTASSPMRQSDYG